MSRMLVLTLVAVALAIGAMIWLAGRAGEVPQTRLEQAVPADALPR